MEWPRRLVEDATKIERGHFNFGSFAQKFCASLWRWKLPHWPGTFEILDFAVAGMDFCIDRVFWLFLCALVTPHPSHSNAKIITILTRAGINYGSLLGHNQRCQTILCFTGGQGWLSGVLCVRIYGGRGSGCVQDRIQESGEKWIVVKYGLQNHARQFAQLDNQLATEYGYKIVEIEIARCYRMLKFGRCCHSSLLLPSPKKKHG